MNQIWLRHQNGNGRKFGNDCEVSADSFLDRKSSVGDSAEIYSSRIIESVISDEVIISNATILESNVKGKTRIIGSGDGVQIFNSDLSGNTRIWDTPILMDVSLDGVLVYGDCTLAGPWSLSDCIRIHKGFWDKPPRCLLIDAENINVVLSECVNDHFHLGCWCLPRKTWFRRGYRERLGKRSGWTPQQIEFAFDTFSGWAQ